MRRSVIQSAFAVVPISVHNAAMIALSRVFGVC